MSLTDYNVIVVGARCAGASLATFLARRGVSVLLLDKDSLPSDQILSTHIIHPPGIEILDELGIGKAIRAKAPASERFRINKDDSYVDVKFAKGRADYCPRRKRLDGLLQEAAVKEGVTLLDKTRVTELIHKNGRVAGVKARNKNAEYNFNAPLVVGADGRHSTVAKLAGAEEYLDYDAPRANYWSYWDAPPIWHSDSSYPFDIYIGHKGNDIRFILQTDNEQLLISSLPPVDQTEVWRADPLSALIESLMSDPVIAPLVDGKEPNEKIRGTIHERYFFRTAAGPGWVLVGDAGHHKDFVVGDGITEALIQAKSLSAAIVAGTDEALLQWWRRRDVEALPIFFWAQDEGAPGTPGELDRIIFEELQKRPALLSRMADVVEHKISSYDVVPPPLIFRTVIKSLLRGKWQVLPEFLNTGRRSGELKRELSKRRKLLEDQKDGITSSDAILDNKPDRIISLSPS